MTDTLPPFHLDLAATSDPDHVHADVDGLTASDKVMLRIPDFRTAYERLVARVVAESELAEDADPDPNLTVL